MNKEVKYIIYFLIGIISYYLLFNDNKLVEGFDVDDRVEILNTYDVSRILYNPNPIRLDSKHSIIKGTLGTIVARDTEIGGPSRTSAIHIQHSEFYYISNLPSVFSPLGDECGENTERAQGPISGDMFADKDCLCPIAQGCFIIKLDDPVPDDNHPTNFYYAQVNADNIKKVVDDSTVTCTTPATGRGYDTEGVTGGVLEAGSSWVDPSGIVCSAGYSGAVTYTPCTTAGDYTLAGCAANTCENTDGSSTAATCGTGYAEKSGTTVCTTCAHDGAECCTACTTQGDDDGCTSESATVCATKSGFTDKLACLTAAAGYTLKEGVAIDNTLICETPTNPVMLVGYDLSHVTVPGNMNAVHWVSPVNIKCAEGYVGEPTASSCIDKNNLKYTLSGCILPSTNPNDQLCNSFDCSQETTNKSNMPPGTTCLTTECTPSECCKASDTQVMCDKYTSCPTGTALKSDAATIEGATAGECCDTILPTSSTCAGFTNCSGTLSELKEYASGISCSGTVCNLEECCEEDDTVMIVGILIFCCCCCIITIIVLWLSFKESKKEE